MPVRVNLALRVVLAWAVTSALLLAATKVLAGGMGPTAVLEADWVYAPLVIGNAIACLVFPVSVLRRPIIAAAAAVVLDFVAALLVVPYRVWLSS